MPEVQYANVLSLLTSLFCVSRYTPWRMPEKLLPHVVSGPSATCSSKQGPECSAGWATLAKTRLAYLIMSWKAVMLSVLVNSHETAGGHSSNQ